MCYYSLILNFSANSKNRLFRMISADTDSFQHCFFPPKPMMKTTQGALSCGT